MDFSYENQTNLGKPVDFQKNNEVEQLKFSRNCFSRKSRKNQEPIKNDKLLWTTDAM